jgi:hypothetical protein
MAESGKVAKITRAVLQVASGAIPFAGGALSAIAGPRWPPKIPHLWPLQIPPLDELEMM